MSHKTASVLRRAIVTASTHEDRTSRWCGGAADGTTRYDPQRRALRRWSCTTTFVAGVRAATTSLNRSI